MACADCPRKAREARPSRSRRGYTNEWRRIREEVLASHGIPRQEWPLYDVDHNPPYNASVEPDHRRYHLVPLLRSEHSRKTARMDTKRDSEGKFTKKW
jgi:hypothetical protein